MIERRDSVELYCPLLVESLAGYTPTEPEISLSLIPRQFIIMFCGVIIHYIVIQQKVAVSTPTTHNSAFMLFHTHHSLLCLQYFCTLAASL